MKTKKRMLAGVTEVIIVNDRRAETLRSGVYHEGGQKALYLGRFRLDKFPKMQRYQGPRGWLSNPVFRLADGSLIWGLECFWKRADSAD